MTLFEKNGNGVVLNCPETPGISVGIRGLYKFSGDRIPSGSVVYANLFNTQWGTNFAEWIEGSFSSKFYIWNYDKYNIGQNFITPTEETRSPLYAVWFEGPGGNVPVSGKGLSISSEGILLTAYCKNRDGEGTILRLWEQAGRDVSCKITLPEGTSYREAIPCNLRGEINNNTQKIPVKGNQLEVEMKANRPVTLILK
jgi:hypothetical protein